MKNYPNIEKSGFPGRQYVGYARVSGIWHISGKTGNWYARCATNRAAGIGAFFACTLGEVSKQLNSW